MTDSIDQNKRFFDRFRDALYNCDGARIDERLAPLFARDCPVRLAHPLGDLSGASGLVAVGYQPLLAAIPDLERRDDIVIGAEEGGAYWLATAGHYTGVMEHGWLGIPATRHLVTLRYIEFFQIADERIVNARMLWDIPALMMQANAWPMAPSLGVEFRVPGPATNDGISERLADPASSAVSMTLVNAMVEGLGRYSAGGAAAMQLEKFWHPKMNWYGPAGIGSMRRISGFRNWHQIPFLDGLPDRRARTDDDGRDCYFADGNYVAYCGWPGMEMTVSGDGWMGIAPGGQKLRMSSLDIWRCENGLIRENWVLIDLLDVYRQLGVDVLARMQQATFARQPSNFQE